MNELVSIDFHGARLAARRGDSPATTLVAMKPVVEGMGLDWEGQRQRILRHPMLAKGACEMQVPSAGGLQAMIALPLSRLNFWLATVQPNKVSDPETRARIIRYQEECADVLFAHFFGQAGGGVVALDDLRQIAGAVVDLKREVAELRAAQDPRVAVRDYISVRELLDEAKARPKGRNGLNRRVGNTLRSLALNEGISLRRCPRTGTWLFPIALAQLWMRRHGDARVREHNAAALGQGVLKFPDRRGSSSPETLGPEAGS